MIAMIMLEFFALEARALIPRLNQGIQCFQQVLYCPVKPDNDMPAKYLLFEMLKSYNFGTSSNFKRKGIFKTYSSLAKLVPLKCS